MTYLKETRAQQNLMSILFCNFLFYDFMTTPLVGVATTLQLCNAHLTKMYSFFSRTHAEKLYLIVCFCYPKKSIFFSTTRFESIRSTQSIIFFEGGVDKATEAIFSRLGSWLGRGSTRSGEHYFFNIYIAINKAWL